MVLKTGWTLLKSVVHEFMEDRVLRLSAAMAYYAIFSIGPLLVLIVGVAGLVLGQEQVRHELGNQLQSLLGSKSAQLVQSMMTPRQHGETLLATIVGGAALALGAAGVFGQLQDALNTIWEVKSKPGVGIWAFLRQRFLSLGMVLVIGFLLLVSMVLSAFVTVFAGYIGHLISLPGWVVQVLNFAAALIVITVLFALIFKVLPDVKLKWRDVIPGALVTTLLFSVGKFLLGFYLARQSSASAYGAGTAFVLVLLYIYYSSVILFFGAEFTQVYTRRSGVRVKPSKYAVPVTEEERAQQGMPRQPSGKGRHEPAHLSAGKRTIGAKQDAPQPVRSIVRTIKGATMHTEGPMRSKDSSNTMAPAEHVRAQPWSFVGLALAAGMTAGLLMRFKGLRKALRLYLIARRFI